MKYTKAQITNLLNNKVLFKLTINSSFYISFDINTYFSFDEFEKISETNFVFWEQQENFQNNSFYNNWKQIRANVKKVREYFLTMQELNIDEVNYVIYQNISSNYSIDSNGIKVYSISVSAPINLDKEFSKIRLFINYYNKNTTNDLPNAVKNFISLSKNNTLIGQYLSNQTPSNFYPALYLLKRDLSKVSESVKDFELNIVKPIQDKLNEISNDSTNQFNEITSFTEEKQKEIEIKFEDKIEEFDEFKNAFNDWEQEKISRIKELEDTYKAKLSLEAPEILWNERSKEYKIRANNCILILVLSIIFTIITATELVKALYKFPIGLTDNIPFISQSFIFISVISFLIYANRIIIKITMSNHHIAMEYEQKASLTRFYQSLLYSKVDINSDERLIIINALFERVDSGLVKNDSTSDGDQLLGLLSRNNRVF